MISIVILGINTSSKQEVSLISDINIITSMMTFIEPTTRMSYGKLNDVLLNDSIIL